MKIFRSYLVEKYSSKSVKSYQSRVQQYLDYLDVDGTEASQVEILEYIGYLRSEKSHPKTIRHHLYSIKIYYNYLQETGQRKDHPCKSLHLKDQINRGIAVECLYTMEQMEQFLKAHKAKQPFLQRRDEVLISLLIYQALTNTEVVNLKIVELDLEKGEVEVNVLLGKVKRNNKSRTLGLKPKQILLIDRYLNQDRPELLKRNKNPNQKDNEILLLTKYGKAISVGSVNRQINQGEEKFMKMSPLKIRQSVIKYKLQAGHNVRVVQEFAGHRSILSTEAYQMGEVEELKKGINKYHPLQ
jgi:site-specific recombinase XerD